MPGQFQQFRAAVCFQSKLEPDGVSGNDLCAVEMKLVPGHGFRQAPGDLLKLGRRNRLGATRGVVAHTFRFGRQAELEQGREHLLGERAAGLTSQVLVQLAAGDDLGHGFDGRIEFQPSIHEDDFADDVVADQRIVDRDTAIVQVFDHGVLLLAVGLEQVAVVDDVAAAAALPPSPVVRPRACPTSSSPRSGESSWACTRSGRFPAGGPDALMGCGGRPGPGCP